MLRVFAPAKINLCLHVTGQRADGYHLLDSLVGFADVGDWVTLSRGAAGLALSGPEAGALRGGGENIITRTLAAFGAGDLTVHLEKNLPVASGIGGGSSDAAAAYRGALALTGRGARPEDAAALLALGADVPICAAAKPALMQGIGAQITPLPNLAALDAVLVNPRLPLSTPQVFAALANKANPATAPLPAQLSDQGALMGWLAAQRNDLQPAAQSVAPAISVVLAAIKGTGARLARMSGSGATCFGLYANPATAARAAEGLRAKFPQWWVQPCQINGPVDVSPQVIRATT
ncbi:MAG: 4-(cytidine 5'-diphospho)-2-C-methyl-D-erythritol kinase [Cypionkella sp.]|nr:4-(cytidine 5'-diphospho)-2-C-methyl-D-erythritol kinase [Cypionkella sp.]